MKVFLLVENGLEVAEGMEFSDGTVVLRWLVINAYSPVKPTTVIHDDLDSVEALHLHDGRRSIKFVWKEER